MWIHLGRLAKIESTWKIVETINVKKTYTSLTNLADELFIRNFNKYVNFEKSFMEDSWVRIPGRFPD